MAAARRLAAKADTEQGTKMATGYEGYQGYGATDPQSVAMRLAQAQLMAGSSDAPIRSRTQGWARLANALMGGYSLGNAQRQQQGSNLTVGGDMGGGAAPSPTFDRFNNGLAISGDAGLEGSNGPPGAPSSAGWSNGQSLPNDVGTGAPSSAPANIFMQPNNAAGGPSPVAQGGGAPSPVGMGMGSPGVQVASANPGFAPNIPSATGIGGAQLPPGFTPPPTASQPGAGGSGAALVAMQDARGGPTNAAGGNPNLASPMADPVPQGGGAMPAGGDQLAQLMQNIAHTESGGNYGIVNSKTGAVGKYQVMPANVGPWTQQVLGQAMTPEQFQNNPQAQEAVAKAKLGAAMQQYGPEGAARVWFTGKPNGTGSDGNMDADKYAALATQGMGGGGNMHAMVAGPGAPSNQAAYGPMSDQAPQGQGGQTNQFSGTMNTTQLPGMPSMQRLMEVMQNPYASPATKELAGQFMQRYMIVNSPHPYTYEKLANGDERQLDWLGNPTGRVLTGSPDQSVQDGGTDMMGVKHQVIFNKQNGQVSPISMPGGQSMPPPAAAPAGPPAPGDGAGQPKVWAPGQPIAPDVDSKLQSIAGQYAGGDPRGQAMIYQYAKALLQGNQQFVVAGTAAKAPYIEAAETIARSLDPDGMPQTRFDTIKQNADTSNPTSLGGQRMAAQTSVRHMGSLAEASDLLGAQQGGASGSELASKVQDWAARNIGVKGGAGGPLIDASQAYNIALTPVLGEVDKLYKGGQATEGEINEMKADLSPTAAPEARRAALTKLSGLLGDKVDVLQKTWHMGVGNSFPDLPIIDQQGQKGLDYIRGWGVAPAAAASGPTQPAQGRGGAEQPPMAGAVRGARGNWLVPDPNRPGKYLQVQ
jgi:hypothetical protein